LRDWRDHALSLAEERREGTAADDVYVEERERADDEALTKGAIDPAGQNRERRDDDVGGKDLSFGRLQRGLDARPRERERERRELARDTNRSWDKKTRELSTCA